MNSKDIRIIFMGTPEFAVESLKALVENGYNVVAVVTVPDKPSGRGQKLNTSAVKDYAVSKNLPVLQPEKLKNPEFIAELSSFKADLQIVVAFRMLPEAVWQMPPLGTFNLHGSLLPDYRGAAPLNWAVINGEAETGVTTFLLKHEIDTGNMIFQEKVSIGEDDNVGSIHDKLMLIGSQLVLKTVEALASGNYPCTDQTSLLKDGRLAKHAPKIFKDDCRINWEKDGREVFNFIRGLSPYPAAFTTICKDEKKLILKIFDSRFVPNEHNLETGSIKTDHKTFLDIAVKDGFIKIQSLQLEGKKRLSVQEFLRGFDPAGYRLE
jgi:methionyl-tRNA formyltransferase